jgi:hypothetical protein
MKLLLQRLRCERLLVFVTFKFLTRGPAPTWVGREPWNPGSQPRGAPPCGSRRPSANAAWPTPPMRC